MEMTIEQKRALALATARLRLQQGTAGDAAEAAANAEALGIPMGQPQEAEKHRWSVLPIETDNRTKKWDWATPRFITDMYDSAKAAVTAPGRALAGDLRVVGPDGNVSPEAIAEGLNFATTFSPGSAASTSRMVPSVDEAAKAAGTTPYALRTIQRKAADDGFDADGLAARLRELGPEANLADVGQNLQDRVGTLARSAGEAKRIVRDVLETRQAGANDRISASADDWLGAAPNPSEIRRSIAAAKDELGPLYDEVFKGASPVDTTDIAAMLDRQIPSVRGDAQRELIKARSMLNKYGTEQLDTNPKTLHEVRKAIDGVLGAEKDNNVIGRLGELRSHIDDQLGRAVPGIKKVDARFHELSRQEEAFKTGRGLLRNTENKLTPDEVRDLFVQGVDPEGTHMGPSGVSTRLQQGVRADIDRAMGTKSNNVAGLRNYIKSEGDWNREVLRAGFGEGKADPFLRNLDNETTFARTLNEVLRNSKTADRLADMAEANGGSTSGIRSTWNNAGFPGLARKAALDTVDKVADALLARAANKRNASLAEGMMTDRMYEVVRALKRLESPKSSPAIDLVTRAILMQNGEKERDERR